MSSPSASGKPWADQPFKLLDIPKYEDGMHAASLCANQMAIVHNIIIRSLNSIYQQAPYVSNPTDVKDFMFYCGAWIFLLEHHHEVEEEHLFPDIEIVAGIPGYMDGLKDQHAAFSNGVADLKAYCLAIKETPETYDASKLLAIIDRFSPPLLQHMSTEIDDMASLKKFDSDRLAKIFQKAADIAEKSDFPGKNDKMLPLLCGSSDKSYPGSETFPPVPFFVPYLVKYWFSRGNQGAWRFLPCDMWCRPRALAFSRQ